MKQYRLVFESLDVNGSDAKRTVIMEGNISYPETIFDLGLLHEEQIQLIKETQNSIIKEQINQINKTVQFCPQCETSNKLERCGQNKSDYHDIFTDHKVVITRKHCPNCKYESPSSIKAIFGSNLSAELAKIQAELGSQYTYRECSRLFELFSHQEREINNHDRVKQTSEIVGNNLKSIQNHANQLIGIQEAKELIINVDGGHINTTEIDKRSFEAMAAVVYKPEALQSNHEGTRNMLTAKHCAVSTANDSQQEMIANTIVAAIQEGLTPNTHVTALCDGAHNCWQIIDAIKPLAAATLCILDWFHLSMKIQNIALPDDLVSDMESIKWHLWHGDTQKALDKLRILILEAPTSKKSKLEKLRTYIENNENRIVNYDERKNQGLVFTSNLAECTIESLINQRCKGQQHMRWSRAGLDPILQLRAAIHSNEWKDSWKLAVGNAITLH